MNRLNVLLLLFLSSCAFVEKFKTVPYVNPWIGKPVSHLDSHVFFIVTPYETRELNDGVKVRNYKSTGPMMYGNGFASTLDCNRLFYIKEDKIIDFVSMGSCEERLP